MAALSNHGLFVEGKLDGVWLNADCPWEFYTVPWQPSQFGAGTERPAFFSGDRPTSDKGQLPGLS